MPCISLPEDKNLSPEHVGEFELQFCICWRVQMVRDNDMYLIGLRWVGNIFWRKNANWL
jgi:hypothetical protein